MVRPLQQGNRVLREETKGKPKMSRLLFSSCVLSVGLCSFLGCMNPVDNLKAGLGAYQGMSLPGTFRPFNDRSPWNTPIGDPPAVHAKSSAIVGRIAASSGQTTLSAEFRNWTPALHVVDSEKIAMQYVRQRNAGAFHESVDPNQDGIAELGAPLTSEMWAEPSADGHLIIVDLKLAKAWEFSRLEKPGFLLSPYWQSSTFTVWDLHGSGAGQPFSGKTWWRFGSRGSGVPAIAGLIRPEEIAAGEIRHALSLSTPCNAKNRDGSARDELVLPAARTDGTKSGADYPLEGARLQLDPALDLNALGLGAEARIVARALQVYGAIIVDNAPNFLVYCQALDADGSGKTWSSRYPGMAGVFKIPIASFRVLDYAGAVFSTGP